MAEVEVEERMKMMRYHLVEEEKIFSKGIYFYGQQNYCYDQQNYCYGQQNYFSVSEIIAFGLRNYCFLSANLFPLISEIIDLISKFDGLMVSNKMSFCYIL